MNWKTDAIVCVVDVETTGLEPGEDRIVSLATCRARADVCVQAWSQVVDPGIPIPEESSKVHGLTDADVAGKPSLADVAGGLLAGVRRADVLCAYNWPFDAAFLAAELGDAWLKAIDGKPVLDPLVVVRFPEVGKFWKGGGRHRLENVYARVAPFATPSLIVPHNPLHDCTMTAAVLWALADHLPDDAEEAAWIIETGRREWEADYARYRSRQSRCGRPAPTGRSYVEK